MTRTIFLAISALLVAACAAAKVSVTPTTLRTKYPILLVHGIGDSSTTPAPNRWIGIYDELVSEGAVVFASVNEPWTPIATNAAMLSNQVLEILAETGAEKVNIIAISKGGLDARYMITALGMGEYVASLTTLSTPHRGTSFAEYMLTTYAEQEGLLTAVLHAYSALNGAKNPQAMTVANELTPAYMTNVFNKKVTNMPGVYYQSYAFKIRDMKSDIPHHIPHRVILTNEGANDGMIPVSSAQWGEFRGVVAGSTNGPGIIHDALIGKKGRVVGGVDIPRFYARIVADLKQRGF